jgi:RNA polymerase sigma factor (sigma-70 family)
MNTQVIAVRPSDTHDPSGVAGMVAECLPSIRRWAHRRLPAAARGPLETCDLVQEVALRMLSKREVFNVRHPNAVQGYMHRVLINLIRDEVRRIARRPVSTELPDELPSHDPSPLDDVLGRDAVATYRRALIELRPKDRALIVARFEQGHSAQEIEREFGYPSTNAARVAVSRALMALARQTSRIAEGVSPAGGSVAGRCEQ